MASNVQKLAMQGRRLTPEEVAELEKKVADQPADIDSRTKLLGYYFLCRCEQPDAEKTHQRHVLSTSAGVIGHNSPMTA